MNLMHMRWAKLYRDMTRQELAAEKEIAKLGVPYRVQFPGFIYGMHYFPDFYLPTERLIIEIDDPSHNQKDRREHDAIRDAMYQGLGIRTIRLTNAEVDEDAAGAIRRAVGPFLQHSDSHYFPRKPRQETTKPVKVKAKRGKKNG